MKIKKFLDIIKNTFNKKEILNEYETLFLKFIKNNNFEKAELMIENHFQTSPLLSKELNKQLLIKLYYNSRFLSINKDFIKEKYKETENESDNEISVNNLLKFLISHDLLGVDFLFDTQKKSLIITNRSVINKKILVKAKDKFNEIFYAKNSIPFEKLFLSRNYFSILKKNKSSLKKELNKNNQFFHTLNLVDNTFFYFENPNIFTSSLSFKECSTINFIENNSHYDFLNISNFRNQLSLKDICKLTDNEKNDLNFLLTKFPILNNKNIGYLKSILNSTHLTNLLLISQLSRHLIQKAIQKKELLPEDLINKLNSSKEYNTTPLRDLIYTIGFLEPKCLKNLDKKLGIEILEKIKESFNFSMIQTANSSYYYNYSYNDKKLQQTIFSNVYNDIKNSFESIVLNHDEEILNKFLKEAKNNHFNDDYLQLAKNLKLNKEIITYLENTQNISKSLLLSLQTTNNSKSLEFQEYINNINEKILHIIYDYQQLNTVVEIDNKEKIESSNFIFLENTILQVQKELENIMNYIHQENINSLITNKKFVKTVIK